MLGMRTIFTRNVLRLHAAKIGAGNVIKKNQKRRVRIWLFLKELELR